jgi:hypothetical protein
MERGEFTLSREALPWWQRARTKDQAVGFVLGFIAAGLVIWVAEKFVA